ncbi:hypothetical protein [uncultured Leifsonia sp.]|jgi:hypothetical protein|uniref:hypothetical protein n=1 Tax=Leifsonia sp. TaxID=1870902 RepID=UPI0028D0891C|nr:hypothetical protein [uncultured Leifsonia sp.]
MPLLEDLTVYEDGDVFSVYDHSFEDEPGRGRKLGEIVKQGEEYVPSGFGAVYEHPSPALTIDDAVAAFVGSA